ncbi:MAG TPA: hypothetical protein VK464_10545 [Symbiobacteriaceae bacterium]|nr:hypothetical protein [Symbiobacteriaceae bacterium]
MTTSHGIRFELIEETATPSDAAVTVRPTGYCRSNTAFKADIMELVESAGTNREKFRLQVGVNREQGLIAVYVVDWDSKGGVPVRVLPNAITFHIGAAFKKYPTLRPVTTVEPEAGVTTDADGRRCLTFNIVAALPKVKSRRGKKAATT